MKIDNLIFDIPGKSSSIIKVIGVGGGGGNAVKYMYEHGITDVDFIVCNTDFQDLKTNTVHTKIQLGKTLTYGRGAGNKPETGEQSAIESLDEIIDLLRNNTKMVFITAGMGGGTGTGAVPIIAKAAKELNILTVAVLTLPFRFEGKKRYNQAVEGTMKVKEHVDALLIINNENLKDIYSDLKLTNAFSKADDVLLAAVKGIAEIITIHGYINVDFADVETVMKDSGIAVVSSAKAVGKNRSLSAIKNALNSPLLNNSDINGARNVLLNIMSGEKEITMDEVGNITDYVQNSVGERVQIIWGTGMNTDLKDEVMVTIIATGFRNDELPETMDIPEKIEIYPKKKDKNHKYKGNLKLNFEKKLNAKYTIITPDMSETMIRKFEKIPACNRRG